MHKLETCLAHFRFGSTNEYDPGPYNVTWFVLDTDATANENVRCFNKDEMNQFIDYVVQTPTNFFGGKNYLMCDDAELLQLALEISSQNEHSFAKRHIVIRKTPRTVPRDIYSYMNIVLSDQLGADVHTFNLDFNVIGRVNSKIL